jgi:hypothetical protein
MNERIRELAIEAGYDWAWNTQIDFGHKEMEKFAELIVRECVEQVEQAKNSLFVSLDDAKRMSHFVDVTTKKIKKHFGVEE